MKEGVDDLVNTALKKHATPSMMPVCISIPLPLSQQSTGFITHFFTLLPPYYSPEDYLHPNIQEFARCLIFNREFVKKGLVDTELGQFFSDMQDSRQEGDYKDFVQFSKEEVAQWLEKAEQFIATVEKISLQNAQIK